MNHMHDQHPNRKQLEAFSLGDLDLESSAEFDDALFLGYAGHSKVHPMWELVHKYKYSFEIPFRQLLPQKVERLMAAGRSCNLQGGSPDDPKKGAVLRMRWLVMMMGHAAGMAAAMAVKDRKIPSELDVLTLRKKLYAQGFPMGGSDERRRRLGLES